MQDRIKLFVNQECLYMMIDVLYMLTIFYRIIQKD